MTAGLDTRGRDAAAALRDLVADTIDDVDTDEAFEILTGLRGRVVPRPAGDPTEITAETFR